MSKKLMRIRSVIGLVSLTLVVTAAASCGDVVRSSRAPVLLVIDQLTGGTTPSAFLLSDVILEPDCTPATTPPTTCPTVVNDPGSATLEVVMKDVTITAPSTNNSVTINRYRVVYRRTDGRNTPGVDVPFPIDGATTATISAGSTGSVGFELVRHTQKEEAPLQQLINSSTIISTVADVTFFGADLVGNDVSATGSIQVNFGNFGDAK